MNLISTRMLYTSAKVAKPVLISGGGPIGRSLAAALTLPNTEGLSAVVYSKYTPSGPLTITYPDKAPLCSEVISTPSLNSKPYFSALFLCGQVQDNRQKTSELIPFLQEGAPIVSFQNGLTPLASLPESLSDIHPFVTVSIAVQIRTESSSTESSSTESSSTELFIPKQVGWEFYSKTQIPFLIDTLLPHLNGTLFRGTGSFTCDPVKHRLTRDVKDLFNLAGNLPSLIVSVNENRAASYREGQGPLGQLFSDALLQGGFLSKARDFDMYSQEYGSHTRFPDASSIFDRFKAYVDTDHIPTNSSAFATDKPQEDRTSDTLQQAMRFSWRPYSPFVADTFVPLLRWFGHLQTELTKLTSLPKDAPEKAKKLASLQGDVLKMADRLSK